jgi:hypothetical protein
VAFLFNFLTLPAEIHEAWAVHEAYRRLGFDAADVGVACDLEHNEFRVLLTTQGKKIEYRAGKLSQSADETLAIWKRMQYELAFGKVPAVALVHVWSDSKALRFGVVLIKTLLDAGIEIPRKR